MITALRQRIHDACEWLGIEIPTGDVSVKSHVPASLAEIPLCTLVESSSPEPAAPEPSFLGNSPLTMPLGRRQDGLPFVMSEKHFAYHMLILGSTRTGKSRFAEGICRMLMACLRGFCFIDPHSDTAENLLAFAKYLADDEGTDAILHQIHFVELTFETVFGYDPFRSPDFSHLPGDQRETAFRVWLETKVDQIAETVQLNQGDAGFQGMPLLQRCLRDCLYAVGVSVDASGTHLPLSDIFVILDTQHKRHKDVFACVRDKLPAEVRSDIERWAVMSVEQRTRETQSTLNRLRALLSGLVQAIFSTTARTIDFKKAIRNRAIILVSLRKSDFLSGAQRDAIATMFLHEIWSAVQTTERENRSDASPYYLFIDEAPKFACKDYAEILSEGAKFKLCLVLIGQHLSQFRKKDLDLVPDLLNLCNTVVAFKQSNPEDLNPTLREFFGYPNLDFTELFSVQDRPDGHFFLKLKELSENFSKGTNWTKALSLMQSNTVSDALSHGSSHAVADAIGTAEQKSHQKSVGSGRAEGKQFDLRHRPKRENEVTNRNVVVADSTSAAKNKIHTNTETTNSSATHTNAATTGETQSVGEGGSEQHGYSVGERTQIIQRFIEQWYPTGRLRHSVDDQLCRMQQRLCTLPKRHAMASLLGETRTGEIYIGDVPDVYSDPREMAIALREFKQKLYRIHDFYVVPDLSPAAQEERLRGWLERVQAEVAAEARATVSRRIAGSAPAGAVPFSE